jgi:hypothetical protein
LVALEQNPDLTGDDDVKLVSRLVLLSQHLAVVEELLVGDGRHLLELRRRQVGEQRDPLQEQYALHHGERVQFLHRFVSTQCVRRGVAHGFIGVIARQGGELRGDLPGAHPACGQRGAGAHPRIGVPQ